LRLENHQRADADGLCGQWSSACVLTVSSAVGDDDPWSHHGATAASAPKMATAKVAQSSGASLMKAAKACYLGLPRRGSIPEKRQIFTFGAATSRLWSNSPLQVPIPNTPDVSQPRLGLRFTSAPIRVLGPKCSTGRRKPTLASSYVR
jgi:hypothetical protein